MMIKRLLNDYSTEEIEAAADATDSTIMYLLFEAERSEPPERGKYLEEWLQHSVELMLTYASEHPKNEADDES